jgi:S1-C subfamily serine protease
MKNKQILPFLLIFLFAINIQTAQGNEIIGSTLEKTVMIIALDDNYQPLGIGSGFLVGKNGEIATNYHVIEGASSALVKFVNKEEKFEVNSILQKSEKLDLAIIQINYSQSPLLLGDDELSSIGDKIYAIGNPGGLEGTVSEGIISGFRKVDEKFRLMQITAPISPGSSGGPVINQKGQVIGIASASIMIGQNLNFAVPSKKLIEIISKPKLNLPFSKTSLPARKGSALNQPTKGSDLVKAFNVKRGTTYQGGSAHISFSVKNNSRRDIKNTKVLIIWKSSADETLHFTPFLIKDVIPSMHAKMIQKNYVEGIGSLPYNFKTEQRIMDYEILKSSGFMEFK